ncbi:MAG: hypothetical protein J7L15_05385 [Clostridiales bacterium]|nr:hypothetical protein [Clostridiales bacterium]
MSKIDKIVNHFDTIHKVNLKHDTKTLTVHGLIQGEEYKIVEVFKYIRSAKALYNKVEYFVGIA